MPFDPAQPYEPASAGKSGFDPGAPYELAKAEPSAYQKSMTEQRAKYAQAADRIRNSKLPEWSKKMELEKLDEMDKKAQLPEAKKWDFIGDMATAATESSDSLMDAGKKAFLSPSERDNRLRENVQEYGPVLGFAKDATVDEAKQFGNALKIPLSAMGVLGSPVIGAAHAIGGSALSYLPGMDKRSGDEAVDQAMMGIGPRSMAAGGPVAQASAAAAQRAAAASSANVNALSANARAAANDPILVQARKAGYVFHPADAVDKPGVVADVSAGLGGKIKTQQEASTRNQQVTNKLAAQELGLRPDAMLDEATFDGVRARSAGAYKVIENSASRLPTGRIAADQEFLNDISALDSRSAEFVADFPEAAAKRSEAVAHVQDQVAKQDFSPKAGIEMIRNLRDDARVNLKNWQDTDKVRTGIAQRDAANALEDLIERRLTQAGDAQAVDNYREARKAIAKAHDVESATDAAGNVDARKLSALGNKRPLSGNLKVIADTAERYPKSMQMPSKFGGTEKHSILDWFATTFGVGGAILSGNPWVAAAAGAPLARPVARSVALSDMLQNRLAGLRTANQFRPMVGQGAVPAITGTNALRSMFPAPGTPAPQMQPQPPQP